MALGQRTRQQGAGHDAEPPLEELPPFGRKLQRFGVAIFDNPRDMSSGWACEAEGTPRYFTSVNDLPTSTVWCTTLDWDEYQHRGKQLHHLRRNDYLRSSLGAIATDIGIRIDGEFAETGCLRLAQVVGNAMQLAATVYGWQDPASDIREDTLHEDIRRTIVQAPKPHQHVRGALLGAFQGHSSPDWAPVYEADCVAITLRYNRLDYAAKLMNCTVPDEGWTRVTEERAADLSLDRLLDPACPSMVEATIEFTGSDPDVATLIAFGSQPGKRAGLRKWVSQPELLWISRFARIHVNSALICRASRTLPDAVKLPPPMLKDPTFSLSISAGLVAESHVHALSTLTYNRAAKHQVASAWAVWLRALDRSLCFSLAHKAMQAGFTPLNYGSGSVRVRVPRTRLGDLLEFASENGIAYPAFSPIFEEHGVS
ncbi:hypothetical protein QRD43_20505 [Pelomonas sp. APW6]|uniref:Uncharacterized protein n=1 Tax=Roseateles subflavus TaxID=3053353 RepID=A0ABT7LN73_9BURK|nr:hypothetical protein [Pelomonas sp. APW6]MDL5034295.1 hypothetical protein [Pelomonas sp. APW6]